MLESSVFVSLKICRAAPPTDFRDGGKIIHPWIENLSAGLCNEAGARSHQRQGLEHTEFLQGATLNATLELPSIAAQTISYSHGLRPTRLFALLQKDGTWKAFVTRAAQMPSFSQMRSSRSSGMISPTGP